ncbi:MAG: hypothetical protein KZQ63_06385 [Candidatus Thiodiazotropha sp. (ex Lucinoma aequizonata)]|nr:hypothetical protein [Candidatus Thiodiazotropha sp. (ex Lucinoma aequizonata)]
MRFLYALHLSLSVAIPAIQARLRLSGTNRLRSAFHGGQRQISTRKCSFHVLTQGERYSFPFGNSKV